MFVSGFEMTEEMPFNCVCVRVCVCVWVRERTVSHQFSYSTYIVFNMQCSAQFGVSLSLRDSQLRIQIMVQLMVKPRVQIMLLLRVRIIESSSGFRLESSSGFSLESSSGFRLDSSGSRSGSSLASTSRLSSEFLNTRFSSELRL